MMLTDAEKQACREARFTGGRRAPGYGTLEEGLCPIGTVTLMRGATPQYRQIDDKRWLHFFAVHHNSTGEDIIVLGPDKEILFQAVHDVIEWAGFPCLNEFLDALEAQGTAIFPAAEVSA